MEPTDQSPLALARHWFRNMCMAIAAFVLVTTVLAHMDVRPELDAAQAAPAAGPHPGGPLQHAAQGPFTEEAMNTGAAYSRAHHGISARAPISLDARRTGWVKKR